MNLSASEKSRGESKHVVLMDYGVGNLGSVAGALRRLGYRTSVASDPAGFAQADAVVLPGVGAMPAAMRTLRSTGLDALVGRLVRENRIPVIGICLGLQLMFQHSDEGDIDCLGLLPGQVRRFPDGGCHVGWSLSSLPLSVALGAARAAFYFNHSYYVETKTDLILGHTEVEGHGPIATVVRAGCFTGMQFHPEKSQAAGAALLRACIEGELDA